MKTLTQLSKAIVIFVLLTTCSKDSGGGDAINKPDDILQYELNVTITPQGSGTVSHNSGKYNKGQQVTITATPSAQKYTFKNWSGGATGTANSITVTMDSNKNVTANFEEIAPVYLNGQGEIGALGGTIKIEDENSPLNGVELIIPEGALATSEALKITLETESTFPYNEVAQVIKFEPEGLIFDDYIEIKLPINIPFENSNELGIVYWDETDYLIEQLEITSIDEEAKVLTGTTNHFSKYIVTKDKVDFDFEMLRISDKDGKSRIGARVSVKGGTNSAFSFSSIRTLNYIIFGHRLLSGHPNAFTCLSNHNPSNETTYSLFRAYLHEKGTKDYVSSCKLDILKSVGPNPDKGYATIFLNDGNKELYSSDELEVEDLDKSAYNIDTMGAWFSGNPLIFRFDDFEYDPEEKYYITLEWALAETNTSYPTDLYTDVYRVKNKKHGEKVSEMLFFNNDTNYDFVDDSFQDLNDFDNDLDGINNGNDNCPQDANPNQEDFDNDGIGDACDNDIDNDGVLNSQDLCDFSAPNATVNGDGCSNTQTDTDGDNVFDDVDKCPNTPIGSGEVDEEGCALSERDTDQDGIFDDKDLCPETPIGMDVDENGCGSLAIISPGPNTIWTLGDQSVNISWETGGLPGNVKIELWLEDAKIGNINNDTPNDGSYTQYDVQNNLDPDKDYQIKIISKEIGTKEAISDYFEIKTNVNLPPSPPTNPIPSNGGLVASPSSLNAVGWNFEGDPEGDDVKFDIYFGNTNPPPLVEADRVPNYYTVPELSAGSTYYWKIIVKDDQGNNTDGPIWNFTVASTSSEELTVNTNEATNITPSSATLNGAITQEGGSSIMDRGFYISYSATNPPTENQYDEIINLGTGGVGPFSEQYFFPDLGVTISFKAFAQNGDGIVFGDAVVAGYASQPPQVAINQPLNNSTYTIGSNIIISGEVVLPEPNTVLSSGEIYIDNVLLGTFSNTNFSFDWDTSLSNTGGHEIKVVATDNLQETDTATVIINLELESVSNRFSPRDGHSSTVFDNKMWVTGGRTGNEFNNDVWSSTDGSNWTSETLSASFEGRVGHSTVVFNNKLWVISGNIFGELVNDVWSSSDGVNWTEEVSNASFSPRYYHSTLVFNNKIWIIGGHISGGYVSDVWSSTDGINWTEETSSTSFEGRFGHSTIVFKNKLWLIGGYVGDVGADSFKNDVWSSLDGINWTVETSTAPFIKRSGHSMVVFDSKLWVIAGGTNFANGNHLNDVWSSSDGINWTEEVSSAGFAPLGDHSTVIFDNKMWVIGGRLNTFGLLTNDVWSSSDGINWIEQ